MEELAPVFERYGIALNMDAHPYDFVERNDYAVQIIRGLNLPWVRYVFCAPHAFHLDDGVGDVRQMMTYAGDKLAYLHIADCYNHKATRLTADDVAEIEALAERFEVPVSACSVAGSWPDSPAARRTR
jgi:sugar phosphate isomerase/epimerase